MFLHMGNVQDLNSGALIHYYGIRHTWFYISNKKQQQRGNMNPMHMRIIGSSSEQAALFVSAPKPCWLVWTTVVQPKARAWLQLQAWQEGFSRKLLTS